MRKCLGQVECNLEELDYRRISLTIHAKALKEALQETDDRIARRGLPRGRWTGTSCSPCKAGRRAGKLRRCGSSARSASWPGRSSRPAPATTLRPCCAPAAAARRERLGVILHDARISPVGSLASRVFRLRIVFRQDFIRRWICGDPGNRFVSSVDAHGAQQKRPRPARRDVGADHFFARLRVLVGTYCAVEPPARSWLASVHLLDGQRSTLDDVDRDWHWSGASHLRKPGIRLVAPTFAPGDKPPRMSRHYSGRLQRGARNKQSSVTFPHRHWTVDVCRRRSAGTALYQRASVQFVSGSVVWPEME